MTTWTSIRKKEAKSVYEANRLLQADSTGALTSAPISVKDIEKKIVAARRDAQKAREALEFAVAAQVQENHSLRSYSSGVAESLHQLEGKMVEAVQDLQKDLVRVEEDLSEIKVFDNVALISKRLLNIDRKVQENRKEFNREIGLFYNKLQHEVYLLKKQISIQDTQVQEELYRLQTAFRGFCWAAFIITMVVVGALIYEIF